jgi:hypothetical protein
MFDRLKNIKTPHGNHFNHLRNMLGYFLAASLIVVFCGPGTSTTGSIFGATLAAAITAVIGLIGGIFVTMIFRSAFKLVQTGRVLQYLGFWLASSLGLLAAAALSGSVAVSSPVLAGFAVFAIGFGSATAFGEVPWRGRTWLPLRRKK